MGDGLTWYILFIGGREGIVDGDHKENPKTGYNEIKFKLSLKSKIMGDF